MAARPRPSYKGDKPYVFITYSHEDKGIVYPQIRWLQDQGWNVSWDDGLSPGAVWRAELAQTIRECSLLLFFVTPNSVRSKHCVREVNFALDDHQRPILAVHLEETVLPDAIALSLSDRQAIYQFTQNPSDYENKLTEALATHVSHDVPLDMPRTSTRLPISLRRRARISIVVASVVSAGLAVLVTWVATQTKPQIDEKEVRFRIILPESVHLPFANEHYVNIVPGGETIVFIGETPDGRRRIYSRRLGELETVPIPGTIDSSLERLQSVYPSPDGLQLAINFSNGSVKRVALSGGTPSLVTETNTPNANRMHWGTLDRIALRSDPETLVQINPAGGELETLVDSGGLWQISFPFYAKEGKLVYFAGGSPDEYSVMVTKQDGSSPVELVANASDPRIAATGHLLFFRDEAVWAAALSEDGTELRGKPAVVLADVKHEGIFTAQYAVANDGTLVYEPAARARSYTLTRIDREGVQKRSETIPQVVYEPRLSPDQTTMSFATGERGGELWTYSLESGALSRIWSSESEVWGSTWSPDGRTLAFSDWKSGNPNLFVTDLAGDKTTRQLTHSRRFQWPTDWTADGTGLLFDECLELYGPCDIAMISLSTSDEPQEVMVVDGEADQRGASLSPSNDYLAYVSNASGFYRIRVRSLPDNKLMGEAPLNGCEVVRWSKQGDELLGYCNRQMVSVQVQTDPTFRLGSPKVLFTVDPSFLRDHDAFSQFFDVSRDGSEFLMVTEQERRSSLVVVLDWLDQVEYLVPLE